MKTLQILMTSLSLIALASFNACASVHTGDLEDLEAAIAAASESEQLPEGSLVNPEEEPDPEAPFTALETLIGEIESLAPGRYGAGKLPHKSRGHVAAAVRHVTEARDGYGGSEPSLLRVFEAIAAAVRELERVHRPKGRRFQSELDELSKRLASVARRVAADTTAVAVAA